MSKGTQIRAVRVPDGIYQQIVAAICSANKDRKEEPYTFTSWALAAFNAKLRHNQRGKKGKGVQ